MKINLKVRMKNKTFVITMLTTVIAFIYQILAMFEIVSPISKEQVTQVIMLLVNILVGFGILVDPTTKGVSDSERALGYKDLGGNK
ncbi:phage holin [Parvimonas sp. KA00067]|uniref:phage holin n=1 Tax=Parvimonas sp. KA00067 TaxID=1588755 RepID=UPI0008383FC1|nr:phage holin [Parvimonas sp. KA00067]